MKYPYKAINKQYLKRAQDSVNRRAVDDNGDFTFTEEEVYCLAKLTGLRTKKRRKIIKRFKNLMDYLIKNIVAENKNENETQL